MKIKPEHQNFVIPTRSTEKSGGYDIFMPEAGNYAGGTKVTVPLGFSTEIPDGHVGLLLPRSGAGFNFGVEVNNTVGVMDSDYRGEWVAAIRTKSNEPVHWEAGDRLLQFIIVPVATPVLEVVDTLDSTARGVGGIGSTGK